MLVDACTDGLAVIDGTVTAARPRYRGRLRGGGGVCLRAL
jgi:hypothetical protein